ncbi:F-box domain-containing protein [Favolaschia claudopus]|uniref:F-box domain-containing protein n=1 Tax=Favolaschia claudopus TaxID=2862362 RepID=A0AAW0CAZ3_9AGAR
MQSVGEDRALIAEIRIRLRDLERSIHSLRAQEATVQQRLDSYKYPVLTLPNEITSEIFIHFLPPYPECAPIVGPLSPTSLTHICRKWRAIALTTPALWSTLGLSALSSPLLSQLNFEGRSTIINTWLRRSGCSPLSIEIDQYWPAASYCPSEAVLAVIPLFRRWEHLKLTLGGEFFPEIDGTVPLLQSLHLALTSETANSAPFASCYMPKLRSVLLTYPFSLDAHLPWDQLTSLGLHDMELIPCVTILRQAVRLEHCSLAFWDDVDVVYTDPNIFLPCLATLDMKSARQVSGFHAALIVPALRQLEIPELWLEPDPIESLKSFITKSGCKLEGLCIGRTSVGNILVLEDSYEDAFPDIPHVCVEFIDYGAQSDNNE